MVFSWYPMSPKSKKQTPQKNPKNKLKNRIKNKDIFFNRQLELLENLDLMFGKYSKIFVNLKEFLRNKVF